MVTSKEGGVALDLDLDLDLDKHVQFQSLKCSPRYIGSRVHSKVETLFAIYACFSISSCMILIACPYSLEFGWGAQGSKG